MSKQQLPANVNANDDEAQWERLVSGLFLEDVSPTNPVLETIPGWDTRFSTIGQKQQSFMGTQDNQSNLYASSNPPEATRSDMGTNRHPQPQQQLYHDYTSGGNGQQQQSRYNFQAQESQDAALAAFNGGGSRQVPPAGPGPSHSNSNISRGGGAGLGRQPGYGFVGTGDHPIEQMPNRSRGTEMNIKSGAFQTNEVHLSNRISDSRRQERKPKEHLQPSYDVEHEYTSRTLFVRNISSNTEDKELEDLFGSYGDIRDMYSACKYRGFVMISFFDERAATAAMDCLQGKALRRRKMDIHFSIPKENQVDAGMLLLFNLEQKIPNSVIATLFRAFGDIKSIKSMQNQSQPTGQNSRTTVRMIEYYDERHAAAALKALNGADVWNIKIRIQFGRVSRVAANHQKSHSPRSNEYSGPSRQGGAFNSQASCYRPQSAHADQEYDPSCSIHSQPQHHSQGFTSQKKYPMINPNSGGDVHLILPYALPGSLDNAIANQQNYQGYPPHHSNHHNNFAYDSHQQQHVSHKRMGGHSHQGKNKSHFSLNLQNIMDGKDRKTTVMIRNIPNKYTQKMLLAEIDVELKGKYDFFYLPIDFKNKCNVGYAFMNLIDPFCILKLYEQFNGKRWSHFNSGKICEITYARIQGKQALTAHFRHSALMQVDEECQPMFPYGQAPVYNQQENTTYA